MSLSYLVPADLPTFYDSRRVLMLASDTGTAAQLSDLTNTGSPAYQFILAAIRTAASDTDSHCQMGQRYTRDVLENFITDALANPTDESKQKRAALLRQLMADLTYGIMASRRGYTAESLDRLCPRYNMALDTLHRLAEGLQIFDTDDAIGAGAPSPVAIGSKVFRPSQCNKLFGYWPDQFNNSGGLPPYYWGGWW